MSNEGVALTEEGAGPDDATAAAVARARSLVEMRDYDRAVPILVARVESTPNDMEALVLLLRCIGGVSEELAVGVQAHIDGLESVGLGRKNGIEVARLLDGTGYRRSARQLARLLYQVYPEDRRVVAFNVDLAFHVGDYNIAIDLLRWLVRHYPATHYNRSLVHGLIDAGRVPEAAEVAEQLVADHPDDVDVLVLRCLCDVRTGRFDRLAEDMHRVIAAHAASDELAKVVQDLIAVGQLELAEQLLTDLTRRWRDNAKFQEQLARVQVRLDRHAASILSLERVLHQAPNPTDMQHLVRAHLALGDVEAAEKVAGRFEQAFPRDLGRHVIRAEIVRAKGDEAATAHAEDLVHAKFVRGYTRPWKVRYPVSILGSVAIDAFGDFMTHILHLCTIKRQHENAHLTIVYNNNLPFKQDILRVCPEVDVAIDMAGRPLSMPTYGKSWAEFPYEIVIPRKGVNPTLLSAYPRKARFIVPPEDHKRLRGQLSWLGVDPARWFATMHYRQGSTFPRRSATNRDVDPANFHALARYVCEELGGQMVRLGHPGMDPAPAIPGYVDLSTMPLDLQFFAVSKARFMIGTDSGPGSLGSAFATPCAKTNAVYEDGAWWEHDILLAKNVVNWLGEVVSLHGQWPDRMLHFRDLADGPNFRLVDNNFAQLKYCADRLFGRTGDCEGWRTGPPIKDPPPPGLYFPDVGGRGGETPDLSALLGLPVRELPFVKIKNNR